MSVLCPHLFPIQLGIRPLVVNRKINMILKLVRHGESLSNTDKLIPHELGDPVYEFD